MTDNEIIKALECCGTARLREHEGDESPCTDCPMQICEDCEVGLPDCALDLINRQKAEIEKLRIQNAKLKKHFTVEIGDEKLEELFEQAADNIEINIKKVKSEAIRGFANVLTKRVQGIPQYRFYFLSVEESINDLVKEMTED